MDEIKKVSYQMLINGQWCDAISGESFERFSPAHDMAVGEYPKSAKADVDIAVGAARAAFDKSTCPALNGTDRARLLNKVAAAIRQQKEELARTEVLESGKPFTQALAEMDSAAGLWEYAASLCRHQYGDAYTNLGNQVIGMVLKEPIGVVAMITPWNFPLLIISQKLPFALAAGCTAVIKPSELTPGTTLMLGKILMEAGFLEGVVNMVTGYGEPVGAALALHEGVDMISFTGSTAVGKKIVAASNGNLKKVSLELGGKNPQIVFPDANLEEVLDAILFGVYFNMGECCNSGSRVLLHEDIAAELTQEIIRRAKHIKVGDPLLPDTKVGAIINQDQYTKITGYVEAGLKEGASLETGGKRLSTGRGTFLEATVFSGVKPHMQIASEEIFGLVLSLLTFKTREEAIQMANNTLYGLSAGVWTSDIDTAFTVARQVKAGTIWINTFMDGYAELPFGGYKQSGLGRELGRFGLDEFCELKTMQVHLGPRQNWWLT
jgi:betaine-aldehyde dehydrogenase